MRIAVFLFIALSFHLHAQSIVNQPAGDLTFLKILNSEVKTGKLSDFKSRIVILDFWATWCAPCIESFPHLEELQSKFKSEIVVITVTDEPEERIIKFLQKRKMSLPIVLDSDRKLSTAFPHRSIPHTVVIGKDGVVKAVTTPDHIDEETLKQIMAGQPTALREKVDNMSFDPSKPLSANENFTYQITVTPFQRGLPSMSDPTGGKGVYKGRRILCTNLSPKTLYEVAFQYPVGMRTVVEVKNRKAFDWSEQTAICFEIIVPAEIGEKRFEIMRQQLSDLYPYKPVIEKRKMNCKVLRKVNGQGIGLKPSAGTKEESSSGGQGLSAKYVEVRTLCDFLEGQLNVPVVDETQITGRYDLELKWYNENPNQIYEELKSVGLELVSANRDVDVLVIYDR